MLYAGCVNLKTLPNLNFNKMMMMIMMNEGLNLHKSALSLSLDDRSSIAL